MLQTRRPSPSGLYAILGRSTMKMKGISALKRVSCWYKIDMIEDRSYSHTKHKMPSEYSDLKT